MVATIKAKSPGDLLAMVPNLFGFHPSDSVAVMSLGAGADRFHARVDHPHSGEGACLVAREISATFRRTRRGQETQRCVLVSYTDSGADAHQAVEALTEELGNAGVMVVEAVRAHDGRWYNLTGCEGPCCPVEGTPFGDATHPLTAQLVVAGHPAPLADRAALEASLLGDPADLVDLEDAAARMPTLDASRVRLCEEGRWIQRRVREFATDGVRLSDLDAARLIAATARLSLRDVAWAEMTQDNAPGHVDLWADLLRRTRQQDAAPVAALLAFSAWLAGNGALSWCAVEHSRRSDPAYSLARLITQALAGSVPPSFCGERRHRS